MGHGGGGGELQWKMAAAGSRAEAGVAAAMAQVRRREWRGGQRRKTRW